MATTSAIQGPEFLIGFEYDPIKNNELGLSLSKPKPYSNDTSAEESLTCLQAGSETGGGSYLSLILSTIQAVKPNHTLFVWHANFHPGLGRRFQSAIISCKFSRLSAPTANHSPQSHPQGLTTPALKIVAHAPRRSFGGSTKQSKTINWGLELPLSVTVGVAEAGLTPSITRGTSEEVDHAFTITGTARGVPHKTTCVWTVEENNSSERGIPSEVQMAMLVARIAGGL